MQTLKLLTLFTFVSIAGLTSFAAGKNKKQMSVQPVNLAVSFEIYTIGPDKNKQLLNTITFDGEQKTLIAGSVKNTGNFKCDCSGQFEIVPLNGQKYLASFFTFECGENDQKTKSKLGRLLLPTKDFQSFSKTIFLHKDYPEVVLKIKEIAL